MEGDGEGMVAIVQGLNDAGVTLTVVNRPRQDTERRRSPKSRIHISARPTMPAMTTGLPTLTPPQTQRSTVETSTESVARATTGVQICDGRYASSYKMAHCRVTPTSPPERVSEFPPQRKEPNRSQGNFEVGGIGSGQARATSARATRRYGGTQTWADRESVYCGKSNRGTEDFVHSLRKYPSMAPIRTVSSDLIEKLIKYTQAKNSPRSSRPTKSMRSLHKDQNLHTSDITKASKHQQTYTRRQSSEDDSSPVGRPAYRGRTRNFKLYSPVSDSRNIKYRDSAFSTSYDYLKAGSSYQRSDRPERPVRAERPTRPERPIRTERSSRSFRDVRLNDVSRYIRSTIREIYNERPVVFQVCPKLKNRYNQHKKNCSSRNTDSMINEEEDQASVPMLSRILASFSGCAMPSTTLKTDGVNCYCTKASQCSCMPDASTNTPHVDFKSIQQPISSKYCHCCPNTIDRSSQSPPKCDCKIPPVYRCSAEDQAYYNKRIDEEISDWLKDVPVHSIESSDNKNKRENMITELEKKLKRLPDDENFDDNAREEINNFITDFPIWYPGKDKKDKKQFKQELADKLLEKIIDIPRRPDRFRDAVKTWIKDIDFEDEDEDTNKEVIIDNIANNLKVLATGRPECDHYYNKILRKEIIEMLEKLPISVEGSRDSALKRIANKLAAQIVSIPKNVNLSQDRTDLKDDFEQNINDWLNELSAVRDNMGELKRDPKLIEALAKKLNKLQAQGIHDETIAKKMREEVHKFMEDLDVTLETLDELIEDLMNQLENTVEENEIENLDQDELAEDIIDWLRGIPGIGELHSRKFKKLANELTSKIREAKLQGNEDYENDIIVCLADADISLDPDILAQHIEELMELLQLWPTKKQYKENVKGRILKEIDDIIGASPIDKDKQKELQYVLANIVTNSLDNSLLDSEKNQDETKETLLEDIDNVIDDTSITNESKRDIKMQVSEVLGKHFDKSLAKLCKDRTNVRQKIAKDVRNIVKELPIDKNKKKDVIEHVGRALDKNLNKPLSDDVEDTINKGIKDIIEESLISEDEEIMGYLKNELSNAAAKVLNIFSPKYKNIGDIQSKVEHDVNNVIEESSLDTDKKEDLKQKVHDILTEYEDQRLSDIGNETVKEKILNQFDILPIPKDKRDELKNKVSATVTKDFDNALFDLRKDMNKIKSKIVKDFTSAIEKAPIDREQKKHLNSKLKGMLGKNLDTSISDEQKKALVDDVSNIVGDVAPEGESSVLKKKLTRTLTKIPTPQKLTKDIKDTIEDELNDIIDHAPLSQIKKDYLQKLLQDKLYNNLGEPLSNLKDKIKQELYNEIENSSIEQDVKNNFKTKMMKVLAKNFDEQPTEKLRIDDYRNKLTKDVNRVIDKLPVDLSEKKELKSLIEEMLAQTLYKPLSDEVKANIEDDIFDIIDSSNIPKDQLAEIKSKLGEVLADDFEKLSNDGKAVGSIKDAIIEDISSVINELQISRAKKNNLIQKVNDALAENLDEKMTDRIQETITKGFNNIFDNSSIPESKKSGLREKVTDIVGQNLDKLPTQEESEEEKNYIKNEITNDMDEFIDGFEIGADVKQDLKKDVQLILNEALYKPLSHEVKENMKEDILNIIEDVTIPEDKKTGLKSQITKTLTDDLDSLINQDKGADEIKNIITDRISKIIEKSPISREKKNSLKKKINGALSKNMVRPLSDDVKETIKDRLSGMIDDSKISKEKQVEFKKQMSNIMSKNFDKLQADSQKSKIVENTVKNLVEEMQRNIEASSMPEENKQELQRKIKKMAAENLNKPLTDEVQETLKNGINNMLGELFLPKHEQDKLKNQLTNTLDEAIKTLRIEEEKIKKETKKERQIPQNEAKESKMKANILEGLERTIVESAIPEEKKMELRKKLNNMAAENLHKPMSDDVQEALKEGISNILDELPVSEDVKEKLKKNLTNIVDENVEPFLDDTKQQEMETRTQDKILQGIEKSIDDSPISHEKKLELKKKLKDMTAKTFDRPFSDKVQEALKHGINEILDELPIQRDEKNALKNQLTDIVDNNIESLKDDIKHKEADQLQKMENRAQDNILRQIEKSIEDSPISKAKKMELKKKLKDMSAKNFNQPFTDEVQGAFKYGINNILDELPLPKDQKNKLKKELTNIVDENVSTLHDNIKTREDLKSKRRSLLQAEAEKSMTKAKILQGIEKTIEESSIPEEKKRELKRKLQSMAADNLNTLFTDDAQEALKDGIRNILDELPVSQDEKNKLKKGLTNVVDQNLDIVKDDMKQKEIKTRTQDNIIRGIEKSIEESTIPPEKKLELKKKLKDMAAKHFNQPFTDEVQGTFRYCINDILDELPLPKEQKNKLKTELTDMVDTNIEALREDMKQKKAEQVKEMETRTQDNILRELEKSIEESPISQEKKLELKEKLIEMAAKNFDQPFTNAVQGALKDGIDEILKELPLPKEQKNKLKNELTNIVDENVNTLHDNIKARDDLKSRRSVLPRAKVEESKAKANILQGIETTIEESSIPVEKKLELKKKLQSMAAENLNKQLTDDVQQALKDGISNILDELPVSQNDKNELKKGLTNVVDINIESLRDERDKIVHAEQIQKIESQAHDNILRGLEKSIEESPISQEKKTELKKKVKEMAMKNFSQPSGNVQGALKYGINDILNELPLPKVVKTKLKNELIGIVDTNIESLKDDLKQREEKQVEKLENRTRDKILRGIEKTIEDAPISNEKKLELRKKLKDMVAENVDKPFSADVQDALNEGINDILDELPLPQDKKNRLKNELTAMVNTNIKSLQDDIIKVKEMPKIKISTIPKTKFDESKTKENILQGIEKTIEESSIPEEKKLELKKKLQSMAADNLKKPFTDAAEQALKDGISNILDELPVSQEEKNKMKKGLTNMVNQNLDTLKGDMQQIEIEARTQDNILRGIEKSIEESTISEEKKNELKKKLKDMATKNFNQPFTDEVQEALRDGINDILDELPLPKEQKNKLKIKLTDMVDTNIESLREDVKQRDAEQLQNIETRTQDNILRGLEKSIEDAPISQEKKLELKKKLIDMAAKNFNQPFTDEVQDTLKDGINEILGELPLPKDQKNKLRTELIDVVNENVGNLRDNIKAIEDLKIKRRSVLQSEINESKLKENILQAIEKTIGEAPIPEEKKIELRKKLQNMAAENLNKPMSDDVQAAIKDGISNILDELPVSKEKKNKLKNELTNMVDKNVESLKDERQKEQEAAQLQEMETRTQDNILRAIEKSIEQSPIPPEKKLELKKKIKDMAAKNFNQPFTDEVQGALRDGINYILDEVPLPKEQKDKMKTELTDMVDTNIESLRDEKKQKEAEKLQNMETRTHDNILRGLEISIEESPISPEKKLELKKKLKEMAVDNFNQPLTDAGTFKDGINKILDELPLPKEQKNKLKNEMTDIVDTNIKSLKDDIIKVKETPKFRKTKLPQTEVGESKMKENILHGIEKTIEVAPIPEEKKVQLRKKLQNMAAANLNNPMSDDVQAAIKDGISNILDELPVSKEKKNKLKKELTNMVDKNVESLKDERQKEQEAAQLQEMETRTQDNILRGIEKSIEQSPIPPEKKLELKKKIKDMAAKNFNQPFTDEVQGALRDGINDILDEVPLAKEQKDKMKTELTDMVDRNIEFLREDMKQKEAEQVKEMETRTQDKILRELEKSIEDSPISQEKKLELKKNLKNVAAKNFNRPFTDEARDALKDGINEILDELPLPKDQKNKLKNELTNIVHENVSTLHDNIKAREDLKSRRSSLTQAKVEESKAKANILQGIEKTIDESSIPEQKKLELKKKLHCMAAENLNKPLTDDVQQALKDGINKILDELPASHDEKNKLKKGLTNMIDKNVKSLRDERDRIGDAEQIQKKKSQAHDNILRGLEKSIEESPISQEKKTELKKKIKEMAMKNFSQPSDDVQGALKDGINDILNELPLPKDEKNKLKNELTGTVDTNIESLKDNLKQIEEKQVEKLENHTRDKILRGIEKSIEDAPISNEKKLELMQKLTDMAGESVNKPLSADVQDALKEGINNILDELPLPKDKKNKLKNELADMVDTNIKSLQDDVNKVKESLEIKTYTIPRTKVEYKIKENILQGIEKTIDESSIPEEKKRELKNKLQSMAVDNLNKPLTDATDQALKDGISNILDELPVSKDEKNKLKKDLTSMVDKNVESLRNARDRDSEAEQKQKMEAHVQDNILRGLEKSIHESPISQEKKMDLKKKLKDMAMKNFSQPYSDDVQDALKDGINEILNELPLPKGEKKKLNQKLTGIVDTNFESLKENIKQSDAKQLEKLENRTRDKILRGIGKSIDDAQISEEKKLELKQKIKDMAAENFKNPLSDDAQITLKAGIGNILDDLSLPEDKKKILKNDLTDVVDENMNALRDNIKAKENLQIPRKSVPDQKLKKSLLPKLEVDKSLKEEIEDVLIKQQIDPAYIPKLEENIVGELQDLVLRGGDIDGAKRNITWKIMQDTNLSEEEASGLSSKLIDIAREMSLVAKATDSDICNQRRLSQNDIPKRRLTELSPKEFIMSPEQLQIKDTLIYTIDGVPYDVDDEDTINEVLQERLAVQIPDIGNPMILKKRMKESVCKSINDIIEQSSIPKAMKSSLKSKLTSKLEQDIDKSPLTQKNDFDDVKCEMLKNTKNIVDASSIPANKKKLLKSQLAEALNKDFQDSLDINLTDETLPGAPKSDKHFVPSKASTPKKQRKSKDKGVQMAQETVAGKEYTEKLTSSIKTWLDNLPVELDAKVKAELLNNLTSDIMERHKYLQVHPETKTSDQEELENLKYQVFRRLSKVVPPQDMGPIVRGTKDLLNKIADIEIPTSIPHWGRHKGRRRAKKRRNDEASQVRRKSNGTTKPTETIEDPLKEEIADVLDVHNIFAENRQDLETDIVTALGELASKGGNTDSARKNVRKSILQSTSLSPFEAEDVSTKLVGRAREMSLIVKVQDSSDRNKKRLGNSDEPKYKYTEETEIEVIEVPEKIKLERKGKVETDLKDFTGTRELDDSTSVNIELVNVPKNHTPSIIKSQIKQTLFKSLSDIIKASLLSKAKKEDVKNKLLNIIEKDLDKSSLMGKEDLAIIKKLILSDINQSLDESSISKDNIHYLKLKLAETLEKELHESILKDKRIRKERLSRNLDDIIAKLPISGNVKTDLKDTLTNIYDETDETLRDQSTQAPPGPGGGGGLGGNVFEGPKLKKYFRPMQHSTPMPNKGHVAGGITKSSKKNGRINFHTNVVDNTAITHQSENPQIASENAELEYTNDISYIFKTWINKSQLKIEHSIKNKIVRQLTGDIVDRKKYFQITPKPKPTFEEDLDNLKYQLYRRMNKQVTVEDLTPVIDEAEDLMMKINQVEVPVMIVPPGFMPRDDSDTDDGSQAFPTAEYDNLIIPLHENVEDILDAHNIIGEDREALEADLISALEELVLRGGDADAVTKNVLDIIKHFTHIDEEDAEEISGELVGVAKEIANIREKGRPYIGKSGIEMKKKDFKEAMLRELGNVFEGCPMSEEKRRLMESQLAEKYAQDLGISLIDSDSEITPKDTKTLETDLAVSVNHWMQTLPINIKDSEEDIIDNKKKEFVSKLKIMVPLGDIGKMKEEAKKSMLAMPLDLDIQNNDELLNEKVEELIDKVVFVPQKVKRSRYGMSFNGLTDYIGNWLDNLNIVITDQDDERIKNIKKELAYNLIHKLGEMNVDPEIFNDMSLYEDVLRDELHNFLDDLTITNPDLPVLIEDLIQKAKQAHHRAHDEIAGQTYKQNLRHTITSILPDPRSLSKDEQAYMELMKDQLADAFINLHYSGSNEDLRGKLKNKITNELNMFCTDYLNKHGTPINSQKLNRDLYNALMNVPLPAEDSIRYEVEQVRIRDEINEWVRTLPLQPQSPTELLARNKMIYVLSKKLFEIETELDDSEDVPMMHKEILKFLKKMPLQPGEDKNAPEFADKLIERLKATELSRKFSESCIVEIDADGNVSAPRGSGNPKESITEKPVCPYYKSLVEKRKAAMKERPQYPPCSLSPEDVDHLDRIRQRTCLAPRCITSLLKSHKRNAGVGPRPVDAGSQTELRPESFGTQPQPNELCPAANSQTPRPCPGVPVIPSNQSGYPERRAVIPSSIPPVDNRGEVQPHIIIKQYYWDTVDSSNLEESECQQPMTAPRKQQSPSPYKKLNTPPYADAGTSPYNQPGSSPYQQAGTPPNQEAGTIRQQPNYSQQRMPCDHNFPCVGSKSPQQSQRYPQWSPERSYYVPQDKSSHGSIPCPRSPCPPSPCMSPISPFAPQHQSSPLNSPGYSFRQNDCRMPKRDGLQDQTPCSSSKPLRKERVIELGSLDDLCHARPKKRTDNFDWSYAKYPEEDNFWGTPCMRRVILDEGIDEPLMMEREKKEERVRCKCKERIVPKFTRAHSRSCHRHMSSSEDANNLNRCAKCCGLHCPYPSYLYFRQ